jgi:hypothetical protein
MGLAKTLVVDAIAGESEAMRRVTEAGIDVGASANGGSAAEGTGAIRGGNEPGTNPVEALTCQTLELSNLVTCADLIEHSRICTRSKDTFWLKKANTQVNCSIALRNLLVKYPELRRAKGAGPA